MVHAIWGRNLPVPNFAYHLSKPWTDRFAQVNFKQPISLQLGQTQAQTTRSCSPKQAACELVTRFPVDEGTPSENFPLVTLFWNQLLMIFLEGIRKSTIFGSHSSENVARIEDMLYSLLGYDIKWNGPIQTGRGGGYSPIKVTGVLVVPFRGLNLWIGTA